MKNKLPKAIIKKYGISKKAWSVYRHSHSSGSSRGGAKVAKKKGSKKKSSFAAVGLSFAKPVMAFVWGWGRGKLMSFPAVNNILANMPGGPYADNILFGGVAAAIALIWRPINAYIRQGLETIAICESFNAGQKVGAGVSMASMTAGATGGAMYPVVA